MYLKGVNLGNWLVLEKWMNPALFEGTTAEDEYYLPTRLSLELQIIAGYGERAGMDRLGQLGLRKVGGSGLVSGCVQIEKEISYD